METYAILLELADEHVWEQSARFVRVADVFEGFRCVFRYTGIMSENARIEEDRREGDGVRHVEVRTGLGEDDFVSTGVLQTY